METLRYLKRLSITADQSCRPPFVEDGVDLRLGVGDGLFGCLFTAGSLCHHGYDDVGAKYFTNGWVGGTRPAEPGHPIFRGVQYFQLISRPLNIFGGAMSLVGITFYITIVHHF